MAKRVTGYQGEEFGHVKDAKKKAIDKKLKTAGSYSHEGTIKQGIIKSVAESVAELRRKRS